MGTQFWEENRVWGSEVASSLGGEVASVKQGVLVGKGETQRSSSRSFLCNPDGCSLDARPVAGPVLVEAEVLRRSLGIPGRTHQAERPARSKERNRTGMPVILVALGCRLVPKSLHC